MLPADTRRKQFFRWVATFILDHRILAGGVLVTLTGVFLYQATHITYDFGIEKLIPDGSSLYDAYKQSERVFGRDDVTDIVAFPLSDAFEPQGMAHLREVTEALEALDGVESATSLSNARYILGDDDSIGVAQLVPARITPPALVSARDIARSDPRIAGILANQAQDVVSIVVKYGIVRGESQRRLEIGRAITEALERHGRPGVEYHRFGLPRMRNAYAAVMLKENRIVIPGIILALMGMLFLFYRRPAGVLLPLGAVVVAVVWALGMSAWLGRSLNITTNLVIPIVLIVGVADAIHLLNCYRERFAQLRDQREALIRTISEMGVSCFLTTFTTAVGFAVLLRTDIPVLRELGLICAFGVFAAYFVTLLGLPLVLSTLAPFSPPSGMRFGDWTSRYLVKVSSWVELNRRAVLGVSAVLTVLCVFLGAQLKHDARVLEDLHPDHSAVVSRNYVETHFGGGFAFSILMRGSEGTFRSPQRLSAIDALARDMERREGLRRPVGMHSVLSSIHQALVPDATHLPGNSSLLAQELLLYETTGDDALWDFVTEDFSTARITTWAVDDVHSKIEAHRTELLQAARNHMGPDIQIDVVSTMVMGHVLNETLVRNTVTSFMWAFIVVFLTMWWMLKRLRVALVALIPNMAPMLVLMAFLSATQIGLRVSTSFIFAVSFGIAVDDTIHFLSRFGEARNDGHTDLEGVRMAIVGSGRAIVQTTLVLVFGFCALLFSDFVASFNFGLLSAVALGSAVVADLTLLPALLLSNRDS